MGKRGPAPKPAQLKLVEGTLRKDRVAPNYLNPPVVVPECPRWLGKKAKEAWVRVTAELEVLGVVAEIDWPSIAALCMAIQRMQEAAAILNKRGLTYVNAQENLAPRPEVAIERASWKEIRAWCHHFGLSAGARSRISAPAKDEGPKNPFEAL